MLAPLVQAMIGPFFPRARIPQEGRSRCQTRFRGSVVNKDDDDERLILLEEVPREHFGGSACSCSKEERNFRRTGSKKDRYHAARRRRRRPPAGPTLILVATAAAFLVISVSAGKTNLDSDLSIKRRKVTIFRLSAQWRSFTFRGPGGNFFGAPLTKKKLNIYQYISTFEVENIQ